MKSLAFIYYPIPIRIGSGCDASTLPPYESGISIAALAVVFVTLICVSLSMVFEVFGYKDVSDLFFKCSQILVTLCVLLFGIALLCALIGV